ncbi:MAG: putative transport protein [Clostridiales bacterium]|jgi:tripartite-type tricarboxylate transporter receptor subunit TctC|nr:putative transport protein [Clostridiales bacterium]
MKKIVSLLLASVMTLGIVLSGCSTSNSGSKSGSNSDSAPKYPTKGIDLVVCVSPGGTPDLLSRVAAEWLTKYWGVPVSVINKAGGGAISGALEALSAQSDGYTVLTITSQNSSQQHGANTKPPIDINKPTYISRVFDVDLALTVKSDSKWKDIKEFSDWAVANPDKLVWANTGSVSTASFSTAEWYSKIGGDIKKTRMVTTSGGADSATQLASGNVVMNFGDFLGSASMVQAGKIKYLATSAQKRNPYYPDVPTMEENGIKGLTVGMWVGYVAPNGTPDYVVKSWNEAIQKMNADPEFNKKLANVAGRTAYMNSADFKQLVMNESKTYTELAQNLGVRK